MNDRKQLGCDGEVLVARRLEKHGFVIRACNFTTRTGEIDLIAEKDEILAFIEVKTRRNVFFPISVVITKGKQRKIIKTAKWYICQNQIADKVCRFDVAIVTGPSGNQKIEYIQNAFSEG